MTKRRHIRQRHEGLMKDVCRVWVVLAPLFLVASGFALAVDGDPNPLVGTLLCLAIFMPFTLVLAWRSDPAVRAPSTIKERGTCK